MEKVPMTTQGFDRLRKELKELKTVERPGLMKALEEARAHGDISENAEFHAAKEKQSFVEGRIAAIEDKLRRARVVDVSGLSGTTVTFGATVQIIDDETSKKATYRIVGADESDATDGLLSIDSPLARALIGKDAGEMVEVEAPGGPKFYEITSVTFE
jgi:transcription elongation factor GreA